MTTWYEHSEFVEQESADRLQPEFAPPDTENTTEEQYPAGHVKSIVDKVNALHDDIQAKLGHTRP